MNLIQVIFRFVSWTTWLKTIRTDMHWPEKESSQNCLKGSHISKSRFIWELHGPNLPISQPAVSPKCVTHFLQIWQSFWGLTKQKDKGVINQNMVCAKIVVPQRHQRFHMDTAAHLSKKKPTCIFIRSY